MAGQGKAGRGKAGQGMARLGMAWLGTVRLGAARLGKSWAPMVRNRQEAGGLARRGQARQGVA
jgi:hypothetical protein